MNDFTLDWLLPLEEDDQFVGGTGKRLKDLDAEHPIGGTAVNYANGDIGVDEFLAREAKYWDEKVKRDLKIKFWEAPEGDEE